MKCTGCYGSGQVNCPSCGGSYMSNPPCSHCGGGGQKTCTNCDGSGEKKRSSSLGYTPLPEPTTPEEIGKASRGTFIFWFIASMVISVMLGPAGFFIWLMIVTMIGAVNLIQWLLSLGRKKDKPKLD